MRASVKSEAAQLEEAERERLREEGRKHLEQLRLKEIEKRDMELAAAMLAEEEDPEEEEAPPPTKVGTPHPTPYPCGAWLIFAHEI